VKRAWREFWMSVWIVKVDIVLAACAIASIFAMIKWAMAGG
jgi:hypothetical protein